MNTTKTPTPQSISRLLKNAGAVWPPGCNGDGTTAPAFQRGRTGCLHHYPPGWNYSAEGCICPAWFDGGGWHLIDRNEACTAHRPAP